MVVGEFNSSKSSLINALLPSTPPLLPTGPLPTTSFIYLIKHGPTLTHHTSPLLTPTTLSPSPSSSSTSTSSPPPAPPLHIITSPHPLLSSLTLIDTPGTNALSRVHEALTRDFLPRADLILLLTSAERPFAESERVFLEGVQEWRRRVVVVVGKVDLLAGKEERDAVERYVREGVDSVLHLGDDLRVLMVSTRDQASVAALERFIKERVGVEGVYLKLRSPLGVVERVLEDAEGTVQREARVWRLKADMLEEVQAAAADYRKAATDEMERSRHRVENIFLRMQDRSIRWIDEHGSLLQAGEWLRGPSQMQRRYNDEVWTDVKEEVERALVSMLDGLSDCRTRHLRRIQSRLQQTQDEISEHSHHSTLRSLQASTADILASQQAPTSPSSSSAISSALSTSLFASAALNTGAVSLAVSSLLSLTILDLTFLSSGLLALAGLSLMPWRRRQLGDVIRGKGREMHERLAAVMKVEVEAEMDRVDRRVRRGMEGLVREVDKEGARVKAARQELDELRAEWRDLTQQVEALQPNRLRPPSAATL